jgi:alkanesulfonate monooxygenase SsuD/methylene tetrahydromethanopterin reductase-like flavin-dependent oxidoreductase (luciferase family)
MLGRPERFMAKSILGHDFRYRVLVFDPGGMALCLPIDFPKMRTGPKPLQEPHPPVIVSGAFRYAARRALAYGDGWVPHAGRPQYSDVTDFLPQFRQMASEAGRSLDKVPVTVFGVPEDQDQLKLYRDRCVARAVFVKLCVRHYTSRFLLYGYCRRRCPRDFGAGMPAVTRRTADRRVLLRSRERAGQRQQAAQRMRPARRRAHPRPGRGRAWRDAL